MNILLSGALGHMGREVARQAETEGIEILCGVDAASGAADFPVHARFEYAPKADVVVDFSAPQALPGLLAYCERHGVPAVLCTTGYDDGQLAAIDEAAKRVALFRSGNMSLGIALLRALASRAAAVLGEGFDVEIVEAHHNRKKDAPSGTALMLYDAVKDAYEQPRTAVCGRHGRESKRQLGEIGIHALRGGTVTGEHEVCFFGPSERIKLSHSAESRSVFAVGALRAAAFLIGKEPGMYSMDDLVGRL
ncbi:MAG: 4-hydroxy-tetrahydrodipicolinate reductase [Christensenellaceae bacterium]|nr:4-hydroxy-tetrahydrodipicolinate reductase [Christensenellaceae bacterium]